MTSASAKALLLVPPFLKYSGGPLLGVELLKQSARKQGHVCSVLDLNAHWIRRECSHRSTVERKVFIGDHDKPKGGLKDLEERFFRMTVEPFANHNTDQSTLMKRVRYGFLEHEEVHSMAAHLVSASPFGDWARRHIETAVSKEHISTPNLVGVSLLHAGQVVPSVALSMVARNLFQDTLIVWGGPHISGLGGDTISKDLDERWFAADVFVTGHAEQTFANLLNQLAAKDCDSITTSIGQLIQSNSGRVPVSPIFDHLDLYDSPPVLP
jgi:hypothetical protein